MKPSKEINIRIETLLGVFVILSILLTGSVFAFGVSREYMEKDENGNPFITLEPGDTKGMTFVAQNGGGATSPITIQVSVAEGEGIIQLTDSKNTYEISAGGRVDVNAIINVPANAEIGDVYPIAVGFATLQGGSSGGFAFGSSIQQKFNVVVGEVVEEAPPTPVGEAAPEEPELQPEVPSAALSGTSLVVIAIIVLIILILIIYFIIRNRNKKLKEIQKGTALKTTKPSNF